MRALDGKAIKALLRPALYAIPSVKEPALHPT